MTASIAIPQLVFAPQSVVENGATRFPAAAASVARFEQLLYAPSSPASWVQRSSLPAALGSNGLRNYVESLSHRWDAGQNTLKQMTERGQFTSKELVLTQIQMINCALDVEVSSKCAAMFENGVQTLIQRGS